MDPENDEAGPTVVVVATGGEGERSGEDGGEVQIIAPVSEGGETSEVEIARIQADAAVTIAAIEADASIEHHQLSAEENREFAETLHTEELEQCRLRIAELEGQNTALTLELETVRAQLIPPPLEAPPPNPPEPEAESERADGQPESPVDPERAEPPEEPPKPKPKRLRWI